MRRIVFWLAVFGCCCSGWAPWSFGVITPDNPNGGSVQFTVNSSQNVHAISPYIYGMNSAVGSTLNIPAETRPPRRQSLDGLQLGNQRLERRQRLLSTKAIPTSSAARSNTPPGQAVRPSLQAAAANNRGLIVTVPTAGLRGGRH